jgi:hypothetical protein
VQPENEQSTVVPSPPEPLSTGDMTLAAVGGLVGGIVGGLIWGWLVAATDTELGIVAIGVGVLAGFGVVLGARGKHGTALQVIAALAAVVGILFGKYFAFVQVVNKELGDGVASVFDGRTFSFFMDLFGDLFSGFDVLWIVFAVYTAWRIPQGQGFGRWAPGRTRPPAPTG